MSLAVLDTSALMALMLGETGSDKVEMFLEGALLSSVNLAEVGAKMLERGAGLELVDVEVRATGLEIVAFDHAQALESARLRPSTMEKGLSLGDRACLALASLTDRIVVTADRVWAELDLGIDIRLIR